MLSIKKLLTMITKAFVVRQTTLSVDTTLVGAIKAQKRSGIITVVVQNIKTAASGQYTTLGTLPSGWRPATEVYMNMDSPQKTRQLRLSIQTDGTVRVYNYSTAFSNTDTNATTTITFVGGYSVISERGCCYA